MRDRAQPRRARRAPDRARRSSQLYELRTALEVEAARLALERHGGRLPAPVHEALAALERACERGAWGADQRGARATLHGAIVAAAESPRIEAAHARAERRAAAVPDPARTALERRAHGRRPRRARAGAGARRAGCAARAPRESAAALVAAEQGTPGGRPCRRPARPVEEGSRRPVGRHCGAPTDRIPARERRETRSVSGLVRESVRSAAGAACHPCPRQLHKRRPVDTQIRHRAVRAGPRRARTPGRACSSTGTAQLQRLGRVRARRRPARRARRRRARRRRRAADAGRRLRRPALRALDRRRRLRARRRPAAQPAAGRRRAGPRHRRLAGASPARS